MRTTLDLDPDVLQAAREIAGRLDRTMGDVVSQLVREALSPPARAPRLRHGVPLLARRPAGSPPLTMKRVNDLRDD